jgi:hypothetical protein
MIRLALAAMLAFPLAAFAVDPPAPRTIDMTAVLVDQKGKPIPDPTMATPDDPACAKCTPLTLGAAVATALLTERKDEQGLSTLDKAKRATLALRLLDSKAATLTAKETADIVRLMNVWGGIVVVRALPILDPNLDLTDR